MAFPRGTKFGPYEIESLLGAGGMGEVYCARDTRLQRTVAIKILPAHLPSPPSGRTLVEFPMSTASFLGLRVPVSGGGYFRILPYWLTRAGLRQINERNGQPFTFYLHPWEVDPGQPRIRVGALSRFRHYTNLERCEGRLRRLLTEFAFTTMRDALRLRGLLTA